MTKTQTVNIQISALKPVEGREVYFQSRFGAPIHMGTVVHCEKCGKACVANSVGVLSFNSLVSDIVVYSLLENGPELSHCDALDMAVCDSCYVSSDSEDAGVSYGCDIP